VTLETKDGVLTIVREDDSKAAVHGLVRALVNNSVEGVT
jgi:large subunit ribosomal protein L6